MSVAYTCPNPTCGVTLKTPAKVAAGKRVKCPKCNEFFVPEPEPAAAAPAAAPGGALKFADEPPKPPPPPPPPIDDDEDDKKGYGIVKETEAELEAAKKNKPKFGEVQDKFKKSARGPAMAMLVMPSNLLVLEGFLTAVGGLFMFVVGMWPLVFNDGPPAEEELEEAIVFMLLGTVTFGWGAMICFGASQMQELASYNWAMAGACVGVLPLLMGIYGIIILQNPKVKAGFAESEGGPDDDEEEEDKAKKKDDDDDDDEDDDTPKKKDKKGKKAKGDEDDDEDDDDDDAPKKKPKKKPKDDEPKKDKKKAKTRSKDDDDDDDDD